MPNTATGSHVRADPPSTADAASNSDGALESPPEAKLPVPRAATAAASAAAVAGPVSDQLTLFLAEIVTIENHEAHHSNCEYRKVPCPNNPCKDRVPHRELDDHVKACPFRQCVQDVEEIARLRAKCKRSKDKARRLEEELDVVQVLNRDLQKALIGKEEQVAAAPAPVVQNVCQTGAALDGAAGAVGPASAEAAAKAPAEADRYHLLNFIEEGDMFSTDDKQQALVRSRSKVRIPDFRFALKQQYKL
ncbi:hypothetical protein HPB47_013629 [Ixodes persulcatus]|uniref:Uncharacterized protein n=1 Tax=Ixodes persulcatus TaxID=34615 RepID=A0AC60QY93_IXOPE|nr:hypothetical protein HPB47_013629 [Ixodes persulcatus]